MDQAFAVFVHPQAIAAVVGLICLLLALGIEFAVLLLTLRQSLAHQPAPVLQEPTESYDWLYE
jgi:hypothetical protein